MNINKRRPVSTSGRSFTFVFFLKRMFEKFFEIFVFLMMRFLLCIQQLRKFFDGEDNGILLCSLEVAHFDKN